MPCVWPRQGGGGALARPSGAGRRYRRGRRPAHPAQGGNAERRRACLTLLSGRRHRVMTAVVLAAPDGRTTERLVDSVVAFTRLTDDADRALSRHAARAKARPAATRSTATPPASCASCPAATPTWSGCRCSRPRSCCAAWLAGAVTISIRVAASPGEVRVAVVERQRPAGLRALAAGRAGRRRRPASRPRRRRVCRPWPEPSWRWPDAEGFLPDTEGGKGAHRRRYPERAGHPRRAGRQGPAAERRMTGYDDGSASCGRPAASAAGSRRMAVRGPADEVRVRFCSAAAPIR